MVVFGVALITKFEWIIYVSGVFLLYTAFKMLKGNQHEFDPKKSFVFRQIKKIYPITSSMHGHDFFIERMGIKAATPLFVALIIIENKNHLFYYKQIKKKWGREKLYRVFIRGIPFEEGTITKMGTY